MATLEEILNEIDGTESEYKAVTGYTQNSEYKDADYVTVTDRKISDIVNQTSTKGEERSQYIVFRLERYQDGIDITKKTLGIHYETSEGSGDNAPINVMANDEYVLMGWLIPKAVTQHHETITFILYAIGTDYEWKSLTAAYTIQDTLDIGGSITEPDNGWYERFIIEMTGYTTAAAASATAAKTSEDNAKASEEAAKESETVVDAKKDAALNEIDEDKALALVEIEQKAASYISIDEAEKLALKKKTTGDFITLEDAADWRLNLEIFGKSTQDGTPTPDNPVEIKSIKSPKVCSNSGNLFGGVFDEIFELDVIIPAGTILTAFANQLCKIGYYGIKENYIDYWTVTASGKTFTVKGDVKYLKFYSGEQTTALPTIMWVNQGDKVCGYTPYVKPYRSNTATLSDIVLRSTPDGTRDRAFKDSDGLWKVERNIASYQITGNEGLTIIGEGNTDTTEFTFSVSVNETASSNAICWCDCYLGKSRNWLFRNPNDDKVISINYGYIRIHDYDYNADNATAFVDKMKEIMPTLYYALATPTYETLPNSIQMQLNALQTFNGITNIYNDAGADMTVEYVQDVNTVIRALQESAATTE